MSEELKKNKTEISHRITEIRQYFCGGSNKAFSQKLGKTEQYASNICNGSKSIGAETLDLVLETFPDVSKCWLYLGDGDMLRSDNSQQQGTVNGGNSGIIVQHGDNSTYHNHPDLSALIASQQETISKQAKTIDTLTETNRQLSEQMGELIKIIAQKFK